MPCKLHEGSVPKCPGSDACQKAWGVTAKQYRFQNQSLDDKKRCFYNLTGCLIFHRFSPL